MKKTTKILLSFGLIWYVTSARDYQYLPSAAQKKKPEICETFYKGSFEYPEDFDLTSQVKMYYKGNPLPVKNGSFILSEDANANIFNIIFTQTACPEFVKSATSSTCLAHITTHQDCNSRYFHLSRKTLGKEETNRWQIKEVSINKYPFKIPRDRTIIVLMNPDHLAEDTQEIFKNTETTMSKSVISLPTIILHHLLDKNEEKKGAVMSQLSAIDLNTIHATQQPASVSQQRGSTIIVYNKS